MERTQRPAAAYAPVMFGGRLGMLARRREDGYCAVGADDPDVAIDGFAADVHDELREHFDEDAYVMDPRSRQRLHLVVGACMAALLVLGAVSIVLADEPSGEDVAGIAGAGVATLSTARVSLLRLFTWKWSSSAAPPPYTNASLCLENANVSSCWGLRPNSSAPACSAHSGEQACKCMPEQGPGCNIDNLIAATPTTGHCGSLQIYIPGGSATVGANGVQTIVGDGIERYCAGMVLNDQWQENNLIADEDDGPSETIMTQTQCYLHLWSLTWKDGVCKRRQRYLGESCWVSEGQSTTFSSGACVSGASIYHALKRKFLVGWSTDPTEYNTNCVAGVCVPSSMGATKRECSCAQTGPRVMGCFGGDGGICGSDAACMRSTGDASKFYCTSGVSLI